MLDYAGGVGSCGKHLGPLARWMLDGERQCIEVYTQQMWKHRQEYGD